MKSWRLMMCGAVLFLGQGCSAGQESSTDPSQKSAAWIRIKHEVPYNVQPPSGREISSQEIGEAHRAMICGPMILEQVLARPDIAQIPELAKASSPVALLQDRVDFEQLGGSEVWVLSCDWPDPEDAALIANAVMESYLRMVSLDSSARLARDLEHLQDLLKSRVANMQGLKEEFAELQAKSTTAVEVEGVRALREEAVRQSFLRLRQQLDDVKIQLAELESGTEDTAAPMATNSGESDTTQAKLELRAKAIEARQIAVLKELTSLHFESSGDPELQTLPEKLKYEERIIGELKARILSLVEESTAPSRVVLLRKAEPWRTDD